MGDIPDALFRGVTLNFPCGRRASVATDNQGETFYMNFGVLHPAHAKEFLSGRLGEDYTAKIREVHGYASPEGDFWPSSRNLGDLRKVLMLIWGTYSPKVIESAKDMDELYA